MASSFTRVTCSMNTAGAYDKLSPATDTWEKNLWPAFVFAKMQWVQSSAFSTFMSVSIVNYDIRISSAIKTGTPVFVCIFSALKCGQNMDRNYGHKSKKYPVVNISAKTWNSPRCTGRVLALSDLRICRFLFLYNPWLPKLKVTTKQCYFLISGLLLTASFS